MIAMWLEVWVGYIIKYYIDKTNMEQLLHELSKRWLVMCEELKDIVHE